MKITITLDTNQFVNPSPQALHAALGHYLDRLEAWEIAGTDGPILEVASSFHVGRIKIEPSPKCSECGGDRPRPRTPRGISWNENCPTCINATQGVFAQAPDAGR